MKKVIVPISIAALLLAYTRYAQGVPRLNKDAVWAIAALIVIITLMSCDIDKVLDAVISNEDKKRIAAAKAAVVR